MTALFCASIGARRCARLLPRRYLAPALLTCLLALTVTGCSSGLAVRSDEDPGAEFSRDQSWNFFDPMGIEGGYNSPIFGELFREAITREMTERGYRLTENPDLLINVTIRGDDKVRLAVIPEKHVDPGDGPVPAVVVRFNIDPSCFIDNTARVKGAAEAPAAGRCL